VCGKGPSLETLAIEEVEEFVKEVIGVLVDELKILQFYVLSLKPQQLRISSRERVLSRSHLCNLLIITIYIKLYRWRKVVNNNFVRQLMCCLYVRRFVISDAVRKWVFFFVGKTPLVILGVICRV